jgi:hypothetical protein
VLLIWVGSLSEQEIFEKAKHYNSLKLYILIMTSPHCKL